MAQLVLDGYDPGSFYCEMLRGNSAGLIRERIGALSVDALHSRVAKAELYNLGITFTVYSERDAVDRILPFDVIPRALSAAEWRGIESGVIQRVAALNALLHDIYHDQHILRDGVLPADLVLGNANYQPIMRGMDLPHRAYVNICGIDLLRDASGRFLVLEDNARTPSGVGYVIESRHMMMRDDARLPEWRIPASCCSPRAPTTRPFRACVPGPGDGGGAGRGAGPEGRE